VTGPGEPSLSHFVLDLTKGISAPEKKLRRLTDFVTNEIQADSGPNTPWLLRQAINLDRRYG
jgi:hypothetical protein